MEARELEETEELRSGRSQRMEMVNALEDQEVLLKIAVSDPDAVVCLAAVGRIYDKQCLVLIARYTLDDAVREAASERLQQLCMGS
ncbi:hypothetical protein ACFL43_04945 [Thermodesulfobacteriota bacterium]